jgi:transposase
MGEILATTRFETGPGEPSQIDFGERFVVIAGERVKVYFFVLILGFSRRIHVRAFTDERHDSWFAVMESAFRHFGGVTKVVLLDNPKALAYYHADRDAQPTDARPARPSYRATA